jgi:Holliday junction resolvase RusA-like endonuclease
MHWRGRHRLSRDWERDIWVLSKLTVDTLLPLTKRRLQVTRETPTRRQFIRDMDNLYGACKPLSDALKRLALIVDDSQKWLELAEPKQQVSADGKHWTVIEIGET